jgi:DNA (cytosine-5)-methyltransferase 1
MNCIELFAGAGGLMKGLEWAGFQTLLANEIHPDPCKTLQYNFPNVPIIQENIKNLSGLDLLDKANINLSQIKEIDLIAGGPPCQGFSTAGLKDYDDPRNTLIGDFIRIVQDLRPRFFLMENVVGLKTLHQGRLFSRILEQFHQTGYQFNYGVFCVADFGVPQMRKRLVIVGSRDSNTPPFPTPTHAKSGGLLIMKPYIYCGEAIGDIPLINQGEEATKYDKEPITNFQNLMRENSTKLWNHQASKHKPETIEYYALVPPGGTWLDIPPHLRKRKEGIQRWPINGLSRAITTEPTDFLHPTLNRIPTVRELARLQTFPDSYVFLGQRTTGNKMRRLGYCSQTQQVGNAVPPLFAKAIGESLLNYASS